MAYLKAGFLGFQGSGKTRTATELAIGLAKEAGGGKPVAFFDTETGSDYMIPLFEKAGIELLHVKSRAFKDLMQVMHEAEQSCSVVIVDSVTHVWQELQEAYKRKLNRRFGLQFQDWAAVKSEWRQFTDAYLNAHLHCILCGRAGYEYDYSIDPETEKKELIKTGTKMKAEGEMGYEPSLLIEMERAPRDDGKKGWINRAFILKDRTDAMNGSVIDNPKFKDFKPILKRLNIGGEHLGIDTSRTSEDMFDSPDHSSTERRRRVDITLEEIKEHFILHGLDGTSADAKKKRVEALREAFGTSAWTAIENMRLEELQSGLGRLRSLTENQDAEPPPAVNGKANGVAKVHPENVQVPVTEEVA